MKPQKLKAYQQWRRKRHIRKSLVGTTGRPRLSVFRSLKHLYCQIIDDSAVDKNGCFSGKTLVACSTMTPSIREKLKHGGDISAAKLVGEEIAKLAKAKGITKIAFDRAGYRYHGRVKALADAARQGGLEF